MSFWIEDSSLIALLLPSFSFDLELFVGLLERLTSVGILGLSIPHAMYRSISLFRATECLHHESKSFLLSRAHLYSTLRSKEWLSIHNSAPQAGAVMPANLPMRQRRIIYRSRCRGWLELDILFGGWAVKHVPALTDAEVTSVEELLDADTPDVLRWALGQEKPPPQFDNDVMKSLRLYANGDGLVGER